MSAAPQGSWPDPFRTVPRARPTLIRAGLATLAAMSCARIEPPPGGPPDVAPPQLIATRPDSFAQIAGFKGNVEFQFDEVISEGGSPNQGTGSGDLEKLVIFSPSVAVPDVSWRRSTIAVRPSDGWEPNRVYRVELLPGATDLRRNRSTRGTVLTFTTGAPLPSTTIDGTIVDWTTGRPAPAALVEAILMPDSLPYRALADSSGHISFGPLPAGEYIVRGVLDENRNFRADGREAYDSVRLAAGKTAAGELWAFVHDTTPIRIRNVAVGDSASATLDLTQSLDPRQRLAVGQATVRLLPDSSAVPVTSLLPKPVDDSLHRPAPHDTAAGRARSDTAGADSTRTDSARAGRPGIVELEEQPTGIAARGRAELKPLTSRPPLSDKLVVRVSRPWAPGAKYEIEIRAVRNVSGVPGDAKGALTVPKPAALDSTRSDSAAPRKAPPRPGVPRQPAPLQDSLKRRPVKKTP
ncbi:MAG TPA: Ig-like domain-containing protein [Gemmatimonadales bacterium]|nr:Ig-like domain-containing protein [Gemmatimonadales bacterium]